MSWGKVSAAIGEFINSHRGNDTKLNATFLWILWSRLEAEETFGGAYRGIATERFDEIYRTAEKRPDEPFLSGLYKRRADASKLDYLVEQTLRVQAEAARLVGPRAGAFREVPFPQLEQMAEGAGNYYLLRRPENAPRSTSWLRQRRLPRSLFPNLRIIPAQIADRSVAVELRPLASVSDGTMSGVAQMKPMTFNSGATYTVETHLDGGDEYFRVRGLEAGHSRAAEVLDAAFLPESHGNVDAFLFWPELSVDEAVLKAVGRGLQDGSGVSSPLAGEASASARLVMPGTAHMESDRHMFSPHVGPAWYHVPNRAHVYDARTGELLFQQDKLRPFRDTKSKEAPLVEALLRGQKLHVGVADWGTFCVFICLDFIDERGKIWDALDIDFAIVPSMGALNTCKAWREKAGEHHRKWGSLSAIALQAPPSLPGWKHVPSELADVAEVNHV
jgi:hypothetical protein